MPSGCFEGVITYEAHNGAQEIDHEIKVVNKKLPSYECIAQKEYQAYKVYLAADIK